MTKKELMYARIEKHGMDLLTLFPNATIKDPVKLCKALLRLENKAHNHAINYCNGTMPAYKDSNNGRGTMVIDDDYHYNQGEKCADKAAKILGVCCYTAPLVIKYNGDPRGYSLKLVEYDKYGEKSITANIYKDWGGYGILAPDFREAK